MKTKISSVSALQVFQVMRYLALLCTGILLARSALTPEEVGRYETVIFFSAAFSFFWVNGIMQGLLGLADRISSNGRSTLFFQAFLVLQLLSFVAGIVAWIVLTSTAKGGFDKGYFAAIYLFFSTPAFLVEYLYYLKDKARHLLTYGGLAYGLQVAAVGIPAMMGGSLETCLNALLLAGLVRWLWLMVCLAKHASASVSRSEIAMLGKLAAPLAVAAALSGAAEYIDGILVTRFFPEGHFAIFRFGAREFPIALLLANALSNAMVAHIARNSHAALPEMKQRTRRLLHLVFPPAILLMLTSSWLFPFVFGEAYRESSVIFNVYLLLTISRLVFPQAIVLGKRQNHILPRIALLEVSVNIVCSLALLPVFGLSGIAWGTVIAFAVEKVLLVVYNQKRNQLTLADYTPVSLWMFYSLMLLGAYLLMVFWQV